jgi:signal transduction histidine kinase/CheY-like chemotaxis protein
VISAWFGGLGPGLVATGLAGLATAFFLYEPVYSLRIGLDDVIRVAAFSGVAVLISSLQAAAMRSNDRMLRAKDEAVAANLAKDKFLAVLSHELRNPLAPILISASAMEADRSLPGSTREVAATIRRNAELEARLIDDLLDLNRVRAGKLALRLEPVDAHAATRDAVAMCRPDADAKGVRLSMTLAADRPLVRADPARLRQVAWNLLRNAVKFTPSGGEVTVTSATTRDGSFCLEVSDTGIGVEPDALSRIFNAFEQGGDAVTREFGGLGLGLAISRSLAESHGGRLTAASLGRGRGATFTLTLPTLEQPAASRASGGRETAAWATAPARPLRILLVEDHMDTARAVCRLLRGSGHEVTVASTVNDALGAAAAGQFEILISDLGLPDGSGLELMRQLQTSPRLKGIALTGYGSDDDAASATRAGFAMHLTKPVSAQTLEAAINCVTVNR